MRWFRFIHRISYPIFTPYSVSEQRESIRPVYTPSRSRRHYTALVSPARSPLIDGTGDGHDRGASFLPQTSKWNILLEPQHTMGHAQRRREMSVVVIFPWISMDHIELHKYLPGGQANSPSFVVLLDHE